MTAMLALSIVGALLCLGVALRRSVPFLRANLVPATLLAGLLGMVVMNAGLPRLAEGLDAELMAVIVTQLFTLSFISIGLTGAGGGEKQATTARSILTGAWGIGTTWALLFGLTALVGSLVILAVGGPAGMSPFYGLLIPFGFVQGPGQAATMGGIIEDMGWENATSVGLTFAAVGFLAAFLGGVPLARLGMRVGLARHAGTIDASVSRGYYPRDEQTESVGRVTTYPGSVDTLAMHFAVMGICYLIARGFATLLALIPGFIGETLSGLLFLSGMIAAYLVRWLMTRAGISHLLDHGVQARITGFTSDFLIVASFMAVQLAVVTAWLVPILVEALVVVVLTAAVVIFYGQRFGGSHDFERTLALYGTATGTVPTGIALARIVDPGMKTTTIPELGMMNIAAMLATPVMIIVPGVFSGEIPYPVALWLIAAFVAAIVVLQLLTRVVRRRTYSLRTGPVGGSSTAVQTAATTPGEDDR